MKEALESAEDLKWSEIGLDFCSDTITTVLIHRLSFEIKCQSFAF